MRILFIHGGGDNAYAVDRDVVSRLSSALGDAVPIEYPHVAGLERIDWKQTQAPLAELLRSATEDTILVAHSIGASAALKLLAEGTPTKMSRALFLAPPYKAADSHWGVDEFSFDNDFARHLPSDLDLSLYHCEDDDVIPVQDAMDYRKKLPAQAVALFKTGGHQFAGSINAIATAISSRVSRQE